MSIESSIREKIQKNFRPQYLELENESHSHRVPAQSETHFRLLVVSELFEGKSRLDRQRVVLDLLGAEREQGLHALTMRLFTPGEWEPIKETFQQEFPPCHGGSKSKN